MIYNFSSLADVGRVLGSLIDTVKRSAAFSHKAAITSSQQIGVDANTYFVDATGGAVTLTLPRIAEANRPIAVKKIDASANAVIIDGAGSETIDGATTKSSTTQYTSWILVPGASEWHLF